MTNTHDMILRYKAFSSWVAALNEIDQSLWTQPVEQGKWSVSEIISHLMNWDRYLLEAVVPTIRDGGTAIHFPEFDPYNQQAANYAKSGISQAALIEETIRMREQLVDQLLALSPEQYNRPITTNGVAISPHSGQPYTLAYLVEEFVMHDQQHQAQIEQFLQKSA